MKLWIARDKSGYLGLYDGKPTWKKLCFSKIEEWVDSKFLGYLNPNEFPEVTFENSPQEVKFKLVEEE